jgi:hypothetical protein
MSAIPLHFGRRLHDYNVAQGVVELVRHCPLPPEEFKAIVNALLLRAAEFDRDGWYGMDSVEAGLLEAANCLDDVRGPGHERDARDEEQRQRDLRRFMFDGYR